MAVLSCEAVTSSLSFGDTAMALISFSWAGRVHDADNATGSPSAGSFSVAGFRFQRLMVVSLLPETANVVARLDSATCWNRSGGMHA